MWGNCHIFLPVCSLSQRATYWQPSDFIHGHWEQTIQEVKTNTLGAIRKVTAFSTSLTNTTNLLFSFSNEGRNTGEHCSWIPVSAITMVKQTFPDETTVEEHLNLALLVRDMVIPRSTRLVFTQSLLMNTVIWTLDSVLCDPFHRTSSQDYTHRILFLSSECISRPRSCLETWRPDQKTSGSWLLPSLVTLPIRAKCSISFRGLPILTASSEDVTYYTEQTLRPT